MLAGVDLTFVTVAFVFLILYLLRRRARLRREDALHLREYDL